MYPEPQLCTSFKLGNNSLRKAATSGKSDILKSLLLLQQIVAFSSVYFISVTALDVITNVGAIDDLTSTARLVMLLPVAFLDAIFILWVFTSLSATLRSLQSRNTTVKLQLYRRFTNALAAWVWISAAWVAYEMYTKVAAAVLSLLMCCCKFQLHGWVSVNVIVTLLLVRLLVWLSTTEGAHGVCCCPSTAGLLSTS